MTNGAGANGVRDPMKRPFALARHALHLVLTRGGIAMFRSGKMTSGETSRDGRLDQTDADIDRLTASRESLADAFEILTRQPPTMARTEFIGTPCKEQHHCLPRNRRTGGQSPTN